jgi:hypothetical protein
MEKLFLAKIKDSDDRDCVFYVELSGFECNHYFGGLYLGGACFGGYEKDFRKIVDNDFDTLETIYTKEEMQELFRLNDELKSLGYGIEKDSDKYNQGVKLVNEIDYMLDKLRSGDNEELYNFVIEEEKEYCMQEYNLSKEEIDDIFENYNDGYQDRAIICAVYEDKEDLFRDCAFNGLINIDKDLIDYINIESYVDDNILGCGCYYELDNGRIVYYA